MNATQLDRLAFHFARFAHEGMFSTRVVVLGGHGMVFVADSNPRQDETERRGWAVLRAAHREHILDEGHYPEQGEEEGYTIALVIAIPEGADVDALLAQVLQAVRS